MFYSGTCDRVGTVLLSAFFSRALLQSSNSVDPEPSLMAWMTKNSISTQRKEANGQEYEWLRTGHTCTMCNGTLQYLTYFGNLDNIWIK